MHDDSSSSLVTLSPGDDGVAVSAELYGEPSEEVDEQSVRGEVTTFPGDATGDAGSEVRAESARRNAAELMRRSTPGLAQLDGALRGLAWPGMAWHGSTWIRHGSNITAFRKTVHTQFPIFKKL